MPNSLSALAAMSGSSAETLAAGRSASVCRSFTARSAAVEIAGASASRTRSSAVATGCTSKFPTETTRLLVDDDERVRLLRIELDRELREREREGVARSAVHLRDPAEHERILQVARLHLAALERVAEAGQRDPQTRIRPGVADRWVQRRRGSRRSPPGRARPRGRGVEQHARVGEGQRPVPGRNGVVVEQRDRLAAGEREVAAGTPSARSAIGARSPCPIEPSERTSGSRPR